VEAAPRFLPKEWADGHARHDDRGPCRPHAGAGTKSPAARALPLTWMSQACCGARCCAVPIPTRASVAWMPPPTPRDGPRADQRRGRPVSGEGHWGMGQQRHGRRHRACRRRRRRVSAVRAADHCRGSLRGSAPVTGCECGKARQVGMTVIMGSLSPPIASQRGRDCEPGYRRAGRGARHPALGRGRAARNS
jgi:hypothetical protein